MPTNLKIWKLTPNQKNTGLEPLALILADSEQQARLFAGRKFGVAKKVKPGDDTPHNPWNDPAIVSCIHIQTVVSSSPKDVKYPANSAGQIIHPE